ncbi:uncharacterized protein [Zea mays]|uniref:uncharacterized protein isoform X4 n=1 Tax=Zea mays TaxID=4577 RepID=UPI0009AAAFFD|nr:uncharacterized protein LOC109939603 isoform X4 [Zea mays]|eukprot:XP_020393402.1 uncharacterized protein LOC103625705 isoform X4 [Zea mays]
MPPPSASASRLATHWIADALADDESLDFSVLKGWKLRRIGEGFASTFKSRHPGIYMYQEIYTTRNFFPVEFQRRLSPAPCSPVSPRRLSPASRSSAPSRCIVAGARSQLPTGLQAPPNPLRPAPHPTIPFCRFKEVKNGCHSSVVEMKHYDLCTMNLNEVLSRVEEMSQEEASVCGLMDMDEPSPPSCDDSVEVEDDSCYEGLTDAEWAAENYADWEELYNRSM